MLPFFLPCDTNISSIYGIVCSIVFVLCVPAYGVVLRLVFVLSYVMVEKVESFSRGHYFPFNIYVPVSSSRLALRLVLASRRGFSSCRLVMRLVFSSRRGFLPFRLVFFVLVSCSWWMRVWCGVVRGASHVDSILSWVSCLVSRFVFSSCSRPVPFALVAIRGVDAARVVAWR